jgi:hypothetical protein
VAVVATLLSLYCGIYANKYGLPTKNRRIRWINAWNSNLSRTCRRLFFRHPLIFSQRGAILCRKSSSRILQDKKVPLHRFISMSRVFFIRTAVRVLLPIEPRDRGLSLHPLHFQLARS